MSVTSGRTPVQMTRMRAAIGRGMSQSKREAPHFYVQAEIDMEAGIRWVADARAAVPNGVRVTLTALIAAAVSRTLLKHPRLNAVWDGDQLFQVEAVNLGIAIALPDGLVAPALLDAGDLDPADMSRRLRDLVDRARAGRLRAAEMTNGTFTLSNLGTHDVSSFTAIITPPQVAILATGSAKARAVVQNGEVAARQTMTATLSADHRALDGATAAAFLGDLRAMLEKPQAWAS